MSDTTLALLRGLMDSEAFREALKEFCAEETRLRVADLRSAVRDHQIPRAGIVEGEIGLLDELPALLDKYARRYSPNRL